MDQRVQFISRFLEGERVSDLCREFEISRKTGYKFIDRYKKFGANGLSDQSRRPHHFANRTHDEIERKILNLKDIFPTWGPKKIHAKLVSLHRGVSFPAVSTIGEILDRNGLVKRRKKRVNASHFPSTPVTESKKSNDVWCTDFKGQFRLGNYSYCYPLTITDHFSRYLIGCEALTSTKVIPAIGIFEEIFDEYGLPRAIKSDNGIPFSSNSFRGLSELSAWWMSLGIEIQKSRPAHPQDNGRHERMHKTLKAETTRPSAVNELQQQERFIKFKKTYNNDRPHEALNMKTPTSIYEKSKRTLKQALEEAKYPFHDRVQRVRENGSLRVDKNDYFIGAALRGRALGLRELDSGMYLVSLNRFDLGYLNPVTVKFTEELPQSLIEE